MTLESPRFALIPSQEEMVANPTPGFIALAGLFAKFDEASSASKRNHKLTKESLTALQAKLEASVSPAIENNKTNQTDLVLTQQWTRTLVW